MWMEVFCVSRSPREGVSFLELNSGRRGYGLVSMVGLEGHSIPFSLSGKGECLTLSLQLGFFKSLGCPHFFATWSEWHFFLFLIYFR